MDKSTGPGCAPAGGAAPAAPGAGRGAPGLVLALEFSSAQASLALCRGECPLDSVSWGLENRAQSRHLFARLDELLTRTATDWAQVSCLAVGLGPGSYTGLRVALAAALGLCLPDARPIHGLPSAEALAAEVLAETGAPSVLVLGDARRGQCWARAYATGPAGCVPAGPWLLRAPAELSDQRAAVWATPDWDRLGQSLQPPAGGRLLAEPRTPSAVMVARQAARRLAAGTPSEPLSPIYPRGAADQPAGR